MSIPLSWSRALSPGGGSHLSIALAAILALASGFAQPALASQAAARKSSDQIATAKSDLFLQQAGELRANTCAALYAALGNAAAEGSTYAVRTEANRAAPDDHAVQGTVGMTYNLPDVKGQAAALVSAAPVGNKCEGQFVRIVPFQVSCSQVLRDFPAGSKPIGDLSGVPFYQLGGEGGQALTIQSGGTCVVVSIVQGQQKL